MISQSQWGVHEKLGPRFENIPTPSPSSGVFASRLRDCETVVVHWTVFVYGGPVHRDTTQGTPGSHLNSVTWPRPHLGEDRLPPVRCRAWLMPQVLGLRIQLSERATAVTLMIQNGNAR